MSTRPERIGRYQRRPLTSDASEAPRGSCRTWEVVPDPDGPMLARRAVARAVRLAAGIRDEGPHTVAEATDTLPRQELVALVVALAAMVPADVDPVAALAWVETPAAEWPDRLLVAEAARHDTGARDATAVLAALELDRRLAAMQRTTRCAS